jgi:hypothetical protein
MNKILTSLLLGAALAAPAYAVPFIGPGSPGALTTSATGNLALGAGGGSATATAASLVLVGGDAEPNGCTGASYSVLGPCRVQAVYAAPGIYAFDWAYSTADGAGPAGDMFGVLVDGVAITLSDLGGATAQSGSGQFSAATSFGWFLNCTDCIGGSATATVTALAVPEPSAWALMLAGGCAVAGRAWRRKVAAA